MSRKIHIRFKYLGITQNFLKVKFYYLKNELYFSDFQSTLQTPSSTGIVNDVNEGLGSLPSFFQDNKNSIYYILNHSTIVTPHMTLRKMAGQGFSS